ncbi:hypothetical protein ACFQ48_17310 [Hymenobacter caeli]|uniref:Uncharacterized protein n=1 Tax=Hymenobacter caeli TaxID=2735894 RepID=A0ABX2FWS1_9BACT|nr:hypothetical protein [Hymenobacter caeli]NRT20749.1 hypothetical protein [Hymenobacter caeli]
MKPYCVKTLKLADWEEDIFGLLLAENEDWLLLRHIAGDYQVDGYQLVAKRFITSNKADKWRAQTARVLKLKSVSNEVPQGFAFGTIVDMLQYIEQRYKLFQIKDEEDTCFCGQLRDYDETHYRINSLSPRAVLDLDYNSWFLFDELITIEFGTDYLESLQLLWQDKVRRKWKIDQRNQSN